VAKTFVTAYNIGSENEWKIKFYHSVLRLEFRVRKTIKPIPTINTTKTKTTSNLIAIVKKPTKAIICFNNVTIKAKIAKILPHFPAAFNQIGITFKTSLILIYHGIALFKKRLKLSCFDNTNFSPVFPRSNSRFGFKIILRLEIIVLKI